MPDDRYPRWVEQALADNSDAKPVQVPRWVVHALREDPRMTASELQVVFAILANGYRVVGADGVERRYWHGDIRELPGGPSRQWYATARDGKSNVERMVDAGYIRKESRDPAVVRPGRAGSSWWVEVGLMGLHFAKRSEFVADGESSAEPLARAGQTTTITAAIAITITPKLIGQLLDLLALEGVSNPRQFMGEHKPPKVLYALQQLVEMRRRGEAPVTTPAAYIAGVCMKRTYRPPVEDLAFLSWWDDQVVELSRRRVGG